MLWSLIVLLYKRHLVLMTCTANVTPSDNDMYHYGGTWWQCHAPLWWHLVITVFTWQPHQLALLVGQNLLLQLQCLMSTTENTIKHQISFPDRFCNRFWTSICLCEQNRLYINLVSQYNNLLDILNPLYIYHE